MAAEIPASRPPRPLVAVLGSVSSPVNRGSHGSLPVHFGSERTAPKKTRGPSKGPGEKQRASGAGAWEATKSSPEGKWAGPCRSPARSLAPPGGPGRPGPSDPQARCVPVRIPHALAFLHLPSPVAAPFCRPPPLALSSGRGIEGGGSAHTTRVIFSGPSQPPAAAQAEGGDSN